MLERLRALLRAGSLAECAATGETFLADTSLVPRTRSVAHHLVCQAYLGLGDHLKALPHAEAALSAAQEAEDLDLIQDVLPDLGQAYIGQRFYDRGIATSARYLQGGEHLPAGARQRIGEVLLHLGTAHRARGDLTAAGAVLAEARRWFSQAGRTEEAEQSRRLLFEVALRQGNLDDLPALLADGEAYLRARGADAGARWQLLLEKAEYAAARQVWDEAVRLGTQALQAAGEDRPRCFRVYMLLHRVARARQDHADALSMALSARITALEGQLYDLEFQATVALIELIRQAGDAALEQLREMERTFAAQGMDVYRWLPESLFRSRADNGSP